MNNTFKSRHVKYFTRWLFSTCTSLCPTVKLIWINTISRKEDTNEESGQLFQDQDHYDFLTHLHILSPIKMCFNRESKKYLCTSDKAVSLPLSKMMDWTYGTDSCKAFTFLMENIFAKFDGMVYKKVGIPIDTNCATLIEDLLLYYYGRGSMSNLEKSKRIDIIDKFNDTSWYLDDIFVIDNLNLINTFQIYIQQNFSWMKQILKKQEKKSLC